MEFNHADLFEGLADAIGDRVAVVCGERRLTYAELDAHANRLAHYLRAKGVRPGQHVGMQLYNGIEYAAALLATLKIRAVPVNVNYRYVEAELLYLYRDSDIVALLYDVEFEPRVAVAAEGAPELRHLIAVGGEPAVAGAAAYERALADQPETRGFPARSGQDVYIIYTGGTTGMPKGVMWHCEDLFMGFGGGNPGGEPRKTPQEVIEAARSAGPMVMMAVPPLMHGAAQMATFITWCMGATMVFVRKFDPVDVLRAVDREKVFTMNITGDAMAIPLADEIATGRYDLGSLFVISSTGAILTGAVRARLEELLPGRMILDNFGSTESGYTASGVAGSSPESGLRYRPNSTVDLAVLDDALNPVKPGSGELGVVARSGRIAFGYYNDPEKTARTFVTDAAGTRWLLTGDLATVGDDGTITVYGRGSVCINTGGEKVFPEEVEAVLKGHPAVFDAVVTGIPDERFGSRVAAVVEPRPGASLTAAELDAHCRERLSGYKVPRTYAFVTEMVRSPAGKADYRWARATAEAAAAASS
ncbi:acyl-CoA synthetase (AMP-forming)/AMP-acid ligase II [Thermocatellispora tengchongensis]|uniref:Acyl-CoA synthetase (AMP-forming)/AMP-acid ligase II n=1 Tax=Thermocatellispora tengchongensis TaxID=1073253 RepID=A0A840PCJ5_9ACTN|nr:acyl-CoA synthetase [Thermocatellispora tengchongensis]MBB5134897.1 acyl-CoA synthetase (AMP-forming)/AMP-acid ligase II [Thermocatellispora tengchongensis]